MTNTTRVAILTRPPIAGATKTRLIPDYGAAAAAHWHEQMLKRTLQTATQAFPGQVSLWVTDSPEHAFFLTLKQYFKFDLHLQQGGDLGERMCAALQASLQHTPRALLVGADCLTHTVASLYEAAQTLQQHDWVFTPAEDGGYVLVGARQGHDLKAAFENPHWGSAEVMAETRRALSHAQQSWAEMPTTWDVDHPADVERARRLGWLD